MLPELFLHSSSGRPPLRIGLLLDGLSLPRCFAEIIEHIERSNFARIELLVIRAEPAAAHPPAPRGSKWRTRLRVLADSKKRKLLGYGLYQKLDRRLFAQDNDPLEEVDIGARLAGVDRISVVPISKGFIHRFTAEDIEEIRKRGLDVILRFGFNILRGDVLRSARYGVWSYHHGDNEFYRGGPALFWEIYEKSLRSGVILQVLTEELDAGHVLAKAIFSTVGGLSNLRNRFTPYWGAVAMMIQKLYELHAHGWEFVEQRAVPRKPYQGKRKIYRAPTNGELAAWLIPAVSATLFRRMKRFFTGKQVWNWRIAWREGQSLLDGNEASVEDISSFRWQMPPAGHFYADPFLIEAEGRKWLFLEDYVYAKSRGVITCIEVLRGGELGEAHTVLNRDYHLSYPFVFEHEGNFYFIPETGDNQTVELYRAIEFPYRWTLEKILFHGKALDTTVLVHDGMFWFFTTVFAPHGEGACFCIFFSDRLDGEWQAHPQNPISMDIRDARAAGRVLRYDGRLFRVTQDGTENYGSSFSFREILNLTQTEYRETLVKTVFPCKPYEGTHSYDACGGFEVVDGVTHAPAKKWLIAADFPPEGPGEARSRGGIDPLSESRTVG
jgi:hypothetical protein